MSYLTANGKLLNVGSSKLIIPSYIASTTLLTGLQHYWNLDDAIGAEAADSVGTMDLSTGGYPMTQRDSSAIIGYSNYNAGTGVWRADLADPSIAYSEFSASFWHRHTTTNGFNAIIANGATSGANGWDIMTSPSYFGYGVLITFFADVGGNTYYTSGATNDGEWYHCVLTYSGSEINIYINGENQRSSAHTVLEYANQRFAIGARWGTGNNFIGNLDEVGLWNRVLTPTDVSTLYNFGNGLGYPFVDPRYWVGDTGNWSDTAHWSLTSGGAGGASVPDSSTSVYFDANSFSTDASITFETTRYVGSLNTSEISHKLSFIATATDDLYCYGSLVWSPLVYLQSTDTEIHLYGTGTYTQNGADLVHQIICHGDFSQTDDLNLAPNLSFEGGLIVWVGGSWDTNGFLVQVRNLGVDEAGIAYMNDSEVQIAEQWLNYWYGDISIGDCSIYMGGVDQDFVGRGLTYPYVKMFPSRWGGGNVIISNSNTFRILELAYNTEGEGSQKYCRFESGTTQTIIDQFIVSGGTSGSQYGILSHIDGSIHTLNYTGSGIIECDYVAIQDSSVGPANTWFALSNSSDNGNNTGWVFLGPEKLTNGDFSDGSTGWDYTVNFIIADGSVYYDDLDINPISQLDADMSTGMTVGTDYLCTFNIDISAGTATIEFLNSNRSTYYLEASTYADGFNSTIITTPANYFGEPYGFSIRATTASTNPFTLDNLTLREIY